MLSKLSLFFIAIFFQLPLFILHGLGGFLGRVAYQLDRRFKERIDANLKRASISSLLLKLILPRASITS